MRIDLLLKRTTDLFKIFFTGKIFKELSEVKSKMRVSVQNPHKLFLVEEEQNAKISVVIPSLNESKYIKNPILSLQAAPYHNFEIIVVDCMSEDDTVMIARKLGAKVILSRKRNVGHQTHLGFTSAKGDIIVRTDADTIFPQGVLVKTAAAFENQQVMVHHIGHLYYDSNILLNLLAHIYDKYWREIWGTTGHFIAVRKSMYKKVAFKPLAKGQDYDFGKRVFEIFGRKALSYDPNTVVLISSRAIGRRRLLRHLLRQGSFRPRKDDARFDRLKKT